MSKLCEEVGGRDATLQIACGTKQDGDHEDEIPCRLYLDTFIGIRPSIESSVNIENILGLMI